MSKEHSVWASSKNPAGCHSGSFFILLTAGILMAVSGLLALTGWGMGRPQLSSFGAGLIPMAPATAVLFLLYGLSVCFRALSPLSVRTFQISVVVGCLTGLVAFLLLVLSCFNIHPSFEHFGLNIAESGERMWVGHMSPVTAFCFLLASVSFLASLPRTVFRRWRINLALGSAGVLFGICFIFLLPYLFGSPLLYGGTFIPPAFSTILAFTMLGLALMILDRRVRGFFDGSPAGNPITTFHFIMIFLFLATGIVVVGNTYYKDIENDYSREVGRKLSAVAELKVGELVQWRKERFMDGSIIFNNPTFSTLVRSFFEKPADENAQRQLLDWLGKYPMSGIYNQVRLLDAQGVCRLVLPAGQVTPCSATAKDAAEVQRSGRMFIQDFYRNDEDQRIYLALMIPVLDVSDTDHPLGVLVMRIDPMSYLYPLIQHWPTSSPSAETLLLRRDGNDVLFLNDLRHLGDTALTMRFPLDRTEVPAVKVALGQTGIMSSMDYRQVPVLSVAEAVPDSPWFLVAKIDTAEIQEPLRKQFWQILVLVGVMLFGAGTTVTLLWRQQRVRFLKEKVVAAEFLRASEIQYRRLFEAARDGILILDAETGMVVDVNPFLVELLGVSREVFLGRNIWELGFFKDILANQAKFSELQQQGYVRYEDMALEGCDGKRHEVEFVSNVYLVNQKKVIQCNIRDISERKLTEERLRLSEARYRFALEITGQIGWSTPPDGAVEDMPMWRQYSGQSLEEVSGWKWLDAVHPEDRESARKAWSSAASQKTNYFTEYRIRRADGVYRNFMVRGIPLLNPDGLCKEWVGTCIDITERKKLEAEKAQSEEQNWQLQKVESLGRMAGAIAHTFNNQLHVVEGYLEMVIGYLPPGDPCIAKLKTAMQAARKASDVSSLMITYLGQKPVKLESLDLSELCRMSLPVFQAGKPETVTLETDLPAPGPVISADSKQIQQLLANLVINAWEAIGDGAEKIKTASRDAGGPESMERRHPGGIGNWNGKDKDCQKDAGGPVRTWNAGIGDGAGTIHLSVRTVSKSDIPLSHRFPLEWRPQEQHYACLEVKDSGCGIQENDIDKIFDPFFSTKFTGRGLGLSVVMGIVKTHKLLVTVENRTDGGVVFSVFFPISENTAALQSEQAAKVPEIVPGATILLVEDEPDVRKMTASMLDSFGFTVLQAKDGVEAVEIFGQRKDEISCLLSDLTMPRMGGWETISAIRAIRHDLPVILSSGYDEASVMEGEHAEMPDFFLNKPYDMKKLGDTVCNAIAKKVPARQKG